MTKLELLRASFFQGVAAKCPTDSSVRKRVSERLVRFVPSRIRRSYAAKFGAVLLAILILIAGIGTFIHFDTKQLVERDTNDELQSAANMEAEALHEWVGQNGPRPAISPRRSMETNRTPNVRRSSNGS